MIVESRNATEVQSSGAIRVSKNKSVCLRVHTFATYAPLAQDEGISIFRCEFILAREVASIKSRAALSLARAPALLQDTQRPSAEGPRCVS